MDFLLLLCRTAVIIAQDRRQSLPSKSGGPLRALLGTPGETVATVARAPQ